MIQLFCHLSIFIFILKIILFFIAAAYIYIYLIWDLSSQTRDWPQATGESPKSNYATALEFPVLVFLIK